MVYQTTHVRVVRGGSDGAVHITKEEKDETRAKERQMVLENQEIRREEIEAKFLVPKSKNFVETESVKEYEERIGLWLKAGYPVHIIGPTGCGKTALAIRVAEKLDKPCIWINGDEAVTTHDLIGGYSRIDMATVADKYIHNVHKSEQTISPQWISNPLTLAVKNGYTLIYNEFSRTKPEANNILLSILEEGVMELPTKFGEERYVDVHPDFSLILTSNNVEYAGVHKPQDALLDRIAAIHMDYYDEDTETKIVQAHSRLKEGAARRIVTLVRRLRSRLAGAEKPGTRPAIMIARALQASKNGHSEEVYQNICVSAIASKFESFEETIKKTSLIKAEIEKLTREENHKKK